MGITSTGYETTPKSTVKSQVEQVFLSALGDDLSLAPETPQGNLISALTDILHQIDMNRQEDFYARDVYHAQGLQLDILGRELGMPRKSAVPTQILTVVKGAINYTIVKDTTASIITNSSQVFKFTTDVLLTSAEQQVTLTATDNSVYENVVVGQKLQTQEYSPQVYDIEVLSVIYGQPAESDYKYRLRLVAAKSANVDEVEHLTLALQNLNNVLSAYVEPNNTLDVSPTGIPPHAVEIVVLGGAEADIFNTILGYLFATPTYRNPTLGEEITGLDYNGHTQTFYITRPEQVNVEVSVTYEDKPGMTLSPENKEAITAKVRDLINSTYMNKTLYASDVTNVLVEGYTPIYSPREIQILINGTPIEYSYTCTGRQYMYATSIEFIEAV